MKHDIASLPISEEELMTKIEQSLADMAENLRQQFEDMRIPFLKLRCRRNELTDEEPLYAIAHRGKQYVIYDEAENNFGLAVTPCNKEDVLSLWVLAGDLDNALRVMESGDYSRCLVAP